MPGGNETAEKSSVVRVTEKGTNKMSDLMKYIPKKFHEAVREAYQDDDGYWVCLNRGWHDGIMDCHTIHTDTISELRSEARLIRKVEEVND